MTRLEKVGITKQIANYIIGKTSLFKRPVSFSNVIKTFNISAERFKQDEMALNICRALLQNNNVLDVDTPDGTFDVMLKREVLATVA